MGKDPALIAFHPTDKIKTLNKAKCEVSRDPSSSTEEQMSDEEMEDEYRSVLMRKSDQDQSAEVTNT